MSESFILQLIWSIFLFILGISVVYFVGLREDIKKLREESKELRRSMNLLSGKPREMLGKGLGTIGIEGILNELGIDVNILNNPIVKGLISRYAPRILEQLSKSKDSDKNIGSEYSL